MSRVSSLDTFKFIDMLTLSPTLTLNPTLTPTLPSQFIDTDRTGQLERSEIKGLMVRELPPLLATPSCHH